MNRIKWYISILPLLLTILFVPSALASSSATATLTVVGLPAGAVMPLRFAPNYTTVDYTSTGYTTAIPIYISASTNTTYSENVPYQWQGAGTTVTYNGVTYTMVGSTYTQLLNVKQNNILGFYVYLNSSLWTSNQTAELKAVSSSLNKTQIMIASIRNTANSSAYGTIKVAGNYLSAGSVDKYASVTNSIGSNILDITFVSTNVIPAVAQLPIKISNYTFTNSGTNSSISLVGSSYTKVGTTLIPNSGAVTVPITLSANTLNPLQFNYSINGAGYNIHASSQTGSLNKQFNNISLSPGQSITLTFDTAGNGNYLPIDPSVTYTSANSNYVVDGTQTLISDLVVGNLTFGGTNTLNTNGYNIYAAGTFNSVGGTIVVGTNGLAVSSVPAASTNNPNSYGGSGGMGMDCNSGRAFEGGNTLIAGGLGSACVIGGSGNGGTPSAPSLSNSVIQTCYNNGFASCLQAGQGGGEYDKPGGTLYSANNGPAPSNGIYIQATNALVGTINAAGLQGCGGGGDSQGYIGCGGSGGGAIWIAYQNTYSAGTYTVTGGSANGGGGYLGGAGGAGRESTFQYTTAPIGISCNNCYLVPAITKPTVSNAIVDVGQTETFTATISGGTANYIGNAIITNGGSIKEKIAVPTQSGLSLSSSYTVAANEVGSETANYLFVDSNTIPTTFNSVSSTAFTVYNALTGSITLTPSTTQSIDNGQSVSFTSTNTLTGGAPPVKLQWYSGSSSCTTASIPIGGATATSYTASPTVTSYYCLIATDSASTNEIISSSVIEVMVSTPPTKPATITTSNAVVDTGQYFTLTGSWTNGVSPYNTIIYNITGTKNQYTQNGLGSSPVTNTLLAGTAGTPSYNVIITDGSTQGGETVNSLPITITVHNAISPNVLTETNTVIIPGGVSKLTAGATAGTPGYVFNWFTGAGCSPASYFATGVSTVVAPGISTVYSFNVIDSASTNNAICSVSNTVTISVLGLSLSSSFIPLGGSNTITVSEPGSGNFLTLTATIPGGQVVGLASGYSPIVYTFGSPYTNYLGVYTVNAYDTVTGASVLSPLVVYSDPYFTNTITQVEYPGSIYPFTQNSAYPYSMSANGGYGVTFNLNYSYNGAANIVALTGVGSYDYFLPPNSPKTGTYVFHTKEMQYANSIFLNASIGTNMLVFNSAACTPGLTANSPAIQYYPEMFNGLNNPCWYNTIPASYIIDGHTNSSGANVVAANGGSTTLWPFILQATYNAFSPSYTFALTTNSGLSLSNINLATFAYITSNTIPSAPNTREILNISTWNMTSPLTPINALTTLSYALLFNNYTISIPLTFNSIVNGAFSFNDVWIPTSNFQNPSITITEATASSSSSLYEPVINSFFPITLTNGFAQNWQIYLTPVSTATLTTISISGCNGQTGVGYYLETFAPGLVNTYAVPASTAVMYLPLAQAIGFDILSSTGQLIAQFIPGVYTSTISLNAGCQIIIPPNQNPIVNAVCHFNYVSNVLVCSGSDINNVLQSWKVNETYTTNPIFEPYVANQQTFNGNTFQYNYQLPNHTMTWIVQIIGYSPNGLIYPALSQTIPPLTPPTQGNNTDNFLFVIPLLFIFLAVAWFSEVVAMIGLPIMLWFINTMGWTSLPNGIMIGVTVAFWLVAIIMNGWKD